MQEEIKKLSLFQIAPNPHQPRKLFLEEELLNLANSIKENGVISPIIVRPIQDDKYEIIAGERRWRASIIAKQEYIPAIVRELNEFESSVHALIENIQRADLNVLEEALAYQSLQEDYQLSHEEIAKSVGKSRSVISNTLRLLTLPAFTQELIKDNKITMGHAKLLLSLYKEADIIYLSGQLVQKQWSVKELQKHIDALYTEKNLDKSNESISNDNIPLLKHVQSIESNLERQLSTSVQFRYHDDGNGFIKIDFYNLEDLERIAKILNIDI